MLHLEALDAFRLDLELSLAGSIARIAPRHRHGHRLFELTTIGALEVAANQGDVGTGDRLAIAVHDPGGLELHRDQVRYRVRDTVGAATASRTAPTARWSGLKIALLSRYSVPASDTAGEACSRMTPGRLPCVTRTFPGAAFRVSPAPSRGGGGTRTCSTEATICARRAATGCCVDYGGSCNCM